jgi:hypothetical protein
VSQNEESPNEFFTELPQSLSRVRNVELLSASVVFYPTEPNIPSYESVLNFTLNGTQRGGILPTNVIYNSPTDLVSRLNTLITSPTYGTFSYNTTTARITYTAPNVGDAIVFTPSVSHCLRRLGADYPLNTAITATGSYTFPNPPIIIRSTTLYVASNLASDALIGGASIRSDIIASIPMTSGTFGTVLEFALSNIYDRTNTFNSNINIIQVALLDDLLQPLPMATNALVNLTFGIQYGDLDLITARLRV